VFEVRVTGLRFRGPHGVFEPEKALGNEFRASLTAVVDGSADSTDAIADTVDYGSLAVMVLRTSASRSFNTVEALARASAEAVLAEHPAVLSVEVTLDKLKPPMDAVVESCGARVVLDRD
jgi:dihydroneopterin aldolase